MPYNKTIEERIVKAITGWPSVESKKMFGGVCYLVGGNMACGIYKDYLIVRMGVDAAAEALQQPHVKPFDITGKPMKGWVMISGEGIRTDAALKAWLERANDFARSLPPKASKTPKKK